MSQAEKTGSKRRLSWRYTLVLNINARSATGHNQDMIALLRDLRDHVSASGQRRIDHLLGSVSIHLIPKMASLMTPSTLQKCPEKHSEPEAGEEAYVSAEVGSSADLDLLDEDLMQDEQTRATGFIGKASEIQWLRELHTRGAGENHTGPYGPPGRDLAATAERLTAMRQRQTKTPKVLMRTNKASYFLDDERSGLDLEADPFELPAFEVAEKLLQVYLETCHNTFPFLSTKAFLHHFYRYYAATNYGKAYEITRQWRAQMNLVFAIGAVYSHLTLADWCGDPRDHLLYHSRAWTLSLKDPWWFTHPDLAQMQTTGLFSFYYMTIGHINRSWILSGMALRFGYALGLHIRNEDRGTGIAHKENLARIWWAHYTLETLLASMTGRPNIGINRTCSVQLPLPISTEDIEEAIISSRFGGESRAYAGLFTPTRPVTSHHSPNSPNQSMHDSSTSSPEPANAGSYLKNLIQLGKITEDSLNLYTAKIVAESWQDIQQKIVRLTEELELWAMSLPERFSFYTRRGIADQRYERERNTLNILYHTTLILITRPCLCRLDRRIINQTAKSNEFNQKTAFACVESAKSVSRLLPNDPQLHLTILYKIGPWWIMVHTIMQSLMVLLLEISLETLQLPHDREEIVFSLKRLVRWLRAMSTNNRMAERAYSLVMNLLKVQGFNKKMVSSIL
ncbi:fungal-specific transcription factor domain-containing protein [Phaeosphaeriaceae sp. PMI808]|nr:fungal-specific transcription factor domain-containing protein [Phaeosphaeriaceae sp. PMI808]